MAKPKIKHGHLNIRVKKDWKDNLDEAAEKIGETSTEYVEKSVEMRIESGKKEK